MGEKYASAVGRFHLWKESVKERWSSIKEKEGGLKERAAEAREDVIKKINHDTGGQDQYDHLYRRKTRSELVRISAAVMGIEFSYAAETAFVSPTLLKIGVRHDHMTMIWCLSPLIGFFLTPVMGSLSDRCGSSLGRRRPFIIILSIGVILGLLLVPNGKWLGQQMGDRYPGEEALILARERQFELEDQDFGEGPGGRMSSFGQEDLESRVLKKIKDNSTLAVKLGLPLEDHHQTHPWGIFFTILGTVLLDFDADSCQSPSRAYLLDVTVPEDHALGLSTFTIMAGLGGAMGYMMGGIDWGWLGVLFGGHVRLVFTLILFIYIICVSATITSFAELPLSIIEASRDEIRMKRRKSSSQYRPFDPNESFDAIGMNTIAGPSKEQEPQQNYGAIESGGVEHVKGNPFAKTGQQEFQMEEAKRETALTVKDDRGPSINLASPYAGDNPEGNAHMATFAGYLWSIIYMPLSLRVLCLTNLFCWMSLVCYSLYFTDFVGEAVFGGDPSARPGTEKRRLYDEGVRFGCWGMAMYSFSCACYSFVIERLIHKFGARTVYVVGQLIYSGGMVLMALTKSAWGVLLFSWSAGVMYSTLFTMPYIIVANYHEKHPEYAAVEEPALYSASAAAAAAGSTSASGGNKSNSKSTQEQQVRGIGTDVGIVSSMVFLAQFILSLTMGSIIEFTGSTVAVIVAAAVLSFCGALSANFVTYLDL